jgi:hypothetical protein
MSSPWAWAHIPLLFSFIANFNIDHIDVLFLQLLLFICVCVVVVVVSLVSRWTWLMHAKFMHELCYLLLHIPTYLHVMRCYNHGLHWFQGFSKQSPSFGFNSLCQKTFFFCIFDFSAATGLKKGKVREHGLKISRRTIWDEVGHQEINVLTMRWAGAVRLPDRATHALLHLEHRKSSVSAWFSFSWTKTIYLKDSLVIHKRRRRRHTKNTNTGSAGSCRR